ncbi:MAG: ferric reductase-like transmembrane domain-containing protein [Chloroflexi bacterium]|nr:ferric reductase-like transmembrane domain-containing protein [Chloroflexota bacterium]
MSLNSPQPNEYESSVNIQSFLTFFVAITLGLLVAVLILPSWLPNMSFSLGGDAPKAYWYLSRATAFVSLTLLWLSMALGLSITNKMARLWPGAPAAFALHEYVSLLGLAFAVFHAIVILGDEYINFTLLQLFVPFSTVDYRPFWVGVGQLAFYGWVVLVASFYIRPIIGQKFWRFLHYASFGMYLLAISHGLFSGTDAGADWAQTYYWISAGSLIFLSMYRILAIVIDGLFPQKRKPIQSPAPRPTQG